MDNQFFTQLRQVEQLSLGLQLALRGTTKEQRAALERAGFGKTRRFATQKLLFILVGCVRRICARPA